VDPMRHLLRSAFLPIIVMSAAVLVPGCSNDESNNPDAKAAEHAIGVNGTDSTKSIETQREVNVIKDTKVVDPKTGQTISETKEVTPVTITKELQEKVNVDAKVGDTKSTTTGEAKIPVK